MHMTIHTLPLIRFLLFLIPQVQNINSTVLYSSSVYTRVMVGFYKYVVSVHQILAIFIIYTSLFLTETKHIFFKKKDKGAKIKINKRWNFLSRSDSRCGNPLSFCFPEPNWCTAPEDRSGQKKRTPPRQRSLRHLHGHCVLCYTIEGLLFLLVILPVNKHVTDQ